jgi:hypothetical protein
VKALPTYAGQFLLSFVVLPEYFTEKEQDKLMVEVERAQEEEIPS